MISPLPVLVVDDDPDIRDGVADVLSLSGYSVITAENGRAALDLLAMRPLPALILLDLMMPVMDGWAFLAEVRASERLAPIPVVILSAMERSRVPQSAGYLRKPFDLDDLLSIVERHVPRD